jgi:predicted PhzF superfamily epimerase YddE/YHI9
VRLPQTSYNVRLTGKDIVAPHLQLHRSREELRGRVFDATAALSLKEDRITGSIGGALVNMKVSTQGDTVRSEGGFLGRPAEVRFSPEALHVYVGGCTYELKNTEGTYVGKRSCDRAFEPPSEVSIPEQFQQLSPSEQVALLLLSLS